MDHLPGNPRLPERHRRVFQDLQGASPTGNIAFGTRKDPDRPACRDSRSTELVQSLIASNVNVGDIEFRPGNGSTLLNERTGAVGSMSNRWKPERRRVMRLQYRVPVPAETPQHSANAVRRQSVPFHR